MRYLLNKNMQAEADLNAKEGAARRPGTRNTSMFQIPFQVFLDFFLQSPLSRTGLMLRSRIDSAMRVAMDIYVLQLRRINYQVIAADPEWMHKIKSVSIYELSNSNRNVLDREFGRKKFDQEIISLLSPSAEIMSVAEYARQMGTTLWFSKEDMTNERNILDALIACGQFTICFNLLEYIIELETEFEEIRTDTAIQALKQDLLKDWERFQTHPEFMVIDFEAKNI